MKDKNKKVIRKIVSSHWVSIFVRLGYFIRGLLYGSVGIFTITLVLGISKKALGTTDVIEKIHQGVGGPILLILIIFGLAGYASWSFIRAFLDKLYPNTKKLTIIHRLGYFFSALSYLLLIIPTIVILVYGKTSHQSSITNKLLSDLINVPYGNFIVICIGILTIIGGLFQIARVYTVKHPSDLWSEETRDIHKCSHGNYT